MHIEELLDEITETVDSGFNLKLFKKRIIDGEKVLTLTDEVKHSLPGEFESAKKITADRNQIIDSANKWANDIRSRSEAEANTHLAKAQEKVNEMIAVAKSKAEAIITQASLQAEHLISETNITKESNERAAALLAKTKEDCDILTQATRSDCDRLTGEAQKWAKDMREGAYSYAMTVLSDVERSLTGSITDVKQVKAKLQTNPQVSQEK